MTTTYRVNELPNIDDQRLIESAHLVQEMRRTANAFTLHLIEQLVQHPVSIVSRVCLAGLQRVQEASVSAEFLCTKNRYRDAAIIILSMVELQLDLLYISQDSARADMWLDHAKENKKPWTVASQLRAVFKDDSEWEAEVENYRRLSMVKHCNPVAGWLAFPFSANRHELFIDRSRNNNSIILPWHFMMGTCIRRSVSASSILLTGEGIDMGDFEPALKASHDRISRLMEEWIIELLRARSATGAAS